MSQQPRWQLPLVSVVWRNQITGISGLLATHIVCKLQIHSFGELANKALGHTEWRVEGETFLSFTKGPSVCVVHGTPFPFSRMCIRLHAFTNSLRLCRCDFRL